MESKVVVPAEGQKIHPESGQAHSAKQSGHSLH